MKVPAVSLTLLQAVAKGSKSAYEQPVGSKSSLVRGSVETCRALQQQLLQDL